MAPDFTTWTITHTHKIKVVATILHGESGHQFNMETKFPFKVLPPDMSAPLADETVTCLDQPLGPEGSEDEADEPPAYDAKEAVTGNSSDVKAGPSKSH